MRLHELDTPCLLLDRSKLIRNLKRMSSRAKALKVDLRPHLKTSKSIEIASLATEEHFGGITVSTLKEAEYFESGGLRDITYAVCITPDKLDRVAKISETGCQINLITDSVNVANAIAQHHAAHSVLIEIDSGEHRTGLHPSSAEILEIARIISSSPRSRFHGVLTHGGHSYLCRSISEIKTVAGAEREAVCLAAGRIRDIGLACDVVSVGSTPTATFADHLEGVTEMRPGVYMLGDLFQTSIDVCAVQDIAVSVLATVISHQKQHNRLVIDAGALALSKDRSTRGTAVDFGFGRLAAVNSGALINDLFVEEVHQEHGQVTSADPLPWEILPVGSRVRVLPNHICMTAAMYDCYHVFENEDVPLRQWQRVNGW